MRKISITDELFRGGLTKEQFGNIREPVEEANRKATVAWSVVLGLYWIVCIIMSANEEAFAKCRDVYIVALVCAVITLLCSLFLAKRVKWTMYPAMYLVDLSFLGAGIGIAVCQPDVRTVTVIAAAIIIPTCFLHRTFATVVLEVLTAGAYVLFGRGIIEPEPYSSVLKYLIFFAVAGVIVGHIINKARFERYLFADLASDLAELQRKYAYYDQMTGLKNRRSYAEVIDGCYDGVPSDLCLVMADINGLKATNDTYGHEAGDELIVAAAECLSAAFEHVGEIYRIGGDEFCIIVNGPKSGAERSLERLAALAAEWKGKYINGFSLSSGICTAEESDDIERIVVEADHRMYVNKRRYYDENGVDRGVM